MAKNLVLAAVITISTKKGTDTYRVSTEAFVADSPANTQFYGSIAQVPSYKKEFGCFVWGESTEQSISELLLINSPELGSSEGMFDALIGATVRDGTVEYYVGESGTAFSTWDLVGKWIIDDVYNPDDDHIAIVQSDITSLIDRNTIHPYFVNTLPFADNRERPMPFCLGIALNAPAVVVDDVNNKYEVHYQNTLNNITTVHDTGDPFAFPADYSKGVQSGGGYGFDLNSPPVGVITAVVSGAKNVTGSGNTLGFYHFIQWIWEENLSLSSSDIDYSGLSSTIASNFSQWLGVYVTEPRNAKQLIEEALVACNGYFYQANNGKLSFNFLDDPKVTADHEIGSADYEATGISEAGVKITFDGAPGLSDTQGTRRNWYVFSYSDLDNVGISETFKQQYSREFRDITTTALSSSAASGFHDSYAHARNGDVIRTLGVRIGYETELVDYLETLYSQERFFYETEYIAEDALEILKMELGETVELVYPRYGLESGKNLIIKSIEMSNMLENKVKLKLWG